MALRKLGRLVLGFPPWKPGFASGQRVGFVVDKVALGQISSEYFGFPCQFSSHRLFHAHHHLSSGAGRRGPTVADVPSGLSLKPKQGTKKKKKNTCTIPVCWIEVPTVMTTKSTIVRDVTPYSLIKSRRCFRGTFCFCVQVRRVSQASKTENCLLPASC
jgi:hypothetical protein